MVVIASEFLEVSIKERGAELQSIYNKKTQLEYMWSGDTAFWSKKSPVLFPIVGEIKNETYYYQGKPYHLSRHGFAREMDFTIASQTATAVTFTLLSGNSTLEKYPFDFRFDIVYTVSGNKLSVTYKVINTGDSEMFFSVGGHPAFKVPLTDGTSYTDYFLEFEKEETEGRWPISKDGLIESTPTSLLKNSKTIPLTKELFQKDALVFKSLKSKHVSLKSENTERGILFDYSGFPFLGIWAAKNADFVCIEPWCGIADSVNTNQQLINKEGINRLETSAVFERTWSVTLL